MSKEPRPQIYERLPKLDAPTLLAVEALRKALAAKKVAKAEYDAAVARRDPDLRKTSGKLLKLARVVEDARRDLDQALAEGD